MPPPPEPPTASKLHEEAARLELAPCAYTTVNECVSFFESKLTFYRAVEPSAPGCKVLRNSKTIAQSSTKQIHGPRVPGRTCVATERPGVGSKEGEEKTARSASVMRPKQLAAAVMSPDA